MVDWRSWQLNFKKIFWKISEKKNPEKKKFGKNFRKNFRQGQLNFKKFPEKCFPLP